MQNKVPVSQAFLINRKYLQFILSNKKCIQNNKTFCINFEHGIILHNKIYYIDKNKYKELEEKNKYKDL